MSLIHYQTLDLPETMPRVKTLIRGRDGASTFIVQDGLESEGSYTPSDVQFTVQHCAAAEALKAEGMVVIPINMMTGHDRCSFRQAVTGGAVEYPTLLRRSLATNWPIRSTHRRPPLDICTGNGSGVQLRVRVDRDPGRARALRGGAGVDPTG